MKTVFDAQIIQLLSLFEKITGVNSKDCILTPKKALFIVPKRLAGKAIGKQGSTIKKLEKVLKRKVKIVEFNEEITEFVKNLYHPLKSRNIICEENIITITPENSITRGSMIGRGGERLRAMEAIIRRHFPLQEIRVEK